MKYKNRNNMIGGFMHIDYRSHAGRLVRSITRFFLIGAIGIGSVIAQTNFPSEPVRILVPFGPGGLADVTMRIAGNELTEKLGQQFIVENHPGAGGIAAANQLLRSDSDGHTLIVMSNGTTIATTLFEDLPYDPQKQFSAISTVAWFDLGFFVAADSEDKDLKDIVSRAESNPGSINIGTVNPGSTQNLAAELFRSVTGLEVNIIPYRTSPDILAALMRGDLDMGVESTTAFSAAIEGNQVRTLAVTGDERNPLLPDVPTVQEAGIDDYSVTGWNALYAPAGTDSEVIDILSNAISEVTDMPKIHERFAELGTRARSISPSEMRALFENDRKKWAEIIEKSGIEKR